MVVSSNPLGGRHWRCRVRRSQATASGLSAGPSGTGWVADRVAGPRGPDTSDGALHDLFTVSHARRALERELLQLTAADGLDDHRIAEATEIVHVSLAAQDGLELGDDGLRYPLRGSDVVGYRDEEPPDDASPGTIMRTGPWAGSLLPSGAVVDYIVASDRRVSREGPLHRDRSDHHQEAPFHQELPLHRLRAVGGEGRIDTSAPGRLVGDVCQLSRSARGR